ncbi:MAG: hypothetical protein Fur0022_07890 [Anaerolineales bacterium]
MQRGQTALPTRFGRSGLIIFGKLVGTHTLHPPQTKTLRWHVDYFLEQKEVELVGVFAIRSPVRLEGELAHWVGDDPATDIIAPGLGAGDMRGETH